MRVGFIPSEGGIVVDTLEEIVLAEELGFHSAWLEEHHSIPGHYWPSPIVALAAVAARTTTISLGTDVIVASFYEPVRLAEDVAMLGAISSGRFTLGMGLDELILRLSFPGLPHERIVAELRLLAGHVLPAFS